MTDRIPLDDMTSDALDQLYDDLARARRELAERAAADSADAAAGSYAGRAEAAEDTVTRVTALYEQWVKAGPPPLGVPMSRWWDRRLVELRGAIHPADESARTTATNPAATEATDTWKEPTHPHPCTAAIEGRATPGGRRVQCTREARHPENHVGPKQGANGRVLWSDRNEGATPHREQP